MWALRACVIVFNRGLASGVAAVTVGSELARAVETRCWLAGGGQAGGRRRGVAVCLCPCLLPLPSAGRHGHTGGARGSVPLPKAGANLAAAAPACSCAPMALRPGTEAARGAEGAPAPLLPA
jgi:hypothetical protein